ncbi:MAG: twin-arginine translocation signal domain-containing protein [Acidimicrobiia bacterium]|nr:twin-arginine translocation signal domain-containing protein [Acidimicrobiia bacterium]
MDQYTEAGAAGLSRRELLKRAAAVGAAAWTVPIVATFNTPALAGVDTSEVPCDSQDCGGFVVTCGGSPTCFCDRDVEGNPICFRDISCGDSPVCATSDDCPPGWRCTTNCCGTTCVPECGVFPDADFATANASGGTAAGR